MNEFDVGYCKDWIGKQETCSDVLNPWPAQALASTLDRLNIELLPGDSLPPLWHWIYFLSTPNISETGYDGHAAKGGFVPPVPLPRRMWAGGRLMFTRLLKIGEQVERRSTIKNLSFKQGRTGRLAFVVVEHEYHGSEGGCIVEEHDIVYRESPLADAAKPAPQFAPARAEWARSILPSPLLLFRYSALTFNGHRIHYDREFCVEEGYSGLVVHAPLTATLLASLVEESLPDKSIKQFNFRAVSPLVDTHAYTINAAMQGDKVLAWALNHAGELAITAELELTG